MTSKELMSLKTTDALVAKVKEQIKLDKEADEAGEVEGDEEEVGSCFAYASPSWLISTLRTTVIS